MSAGSFVCRISFVDLSPHSLIRAEVLSTENETYSQSLNVTITDTPQPVVSPLLPNDLGHLAASVPTHFRNEFNCGSRSVTYQVQDIQQHRCFPKRFKAP